MMGVRAASSIRELGAALRSGRRSCPELIEDCLQRIAASDAHLRAWSSIDAEGARREAQHLQAELEQGSPRGPLHGIPIGVKDIIDVFDMPTGCGSPLWGQSYARADAPVVRQLREHGAVILGKTVTTPFAYLDPSPTRNPWKSDRTPGGSSSGSAAAVASGMVPAALGTQTGGSITRPAAFCGVCSIKPTYKRIAADGVLPLAPTLDHVGLLASCIDDLMLLFAALRRSPPHWPWAFEPQTLVTLPEFLEDPALDPEMHQAFQQWRAATTTQGWLWRDEPLPFNLEILRRQHRIIMAVEAAAYHGPRYARHRKDYPPRIAELIDMGLQIAAADYHQALRHRRLSRRQFHRWMGAVNAVIAVPAALGPAPPADTTGDPRLNTPWSYLGVPAVSWPIGWSDDGLPLAVQLIGPAHGDEAVLAAAQQLAEAVPCPSPPVTV